jgi:hypothetical protein
MIAADRSTARRAVIAGLDPAIHLHARKMDPRVKPAGDGQKGGSTSPERALKVKNQTIFHG